MATKKPAAQAPGKRKATAEGPSVSKRPARASAPVTLARRRLAPGDLVLGGIWLGTGPAATAEDLGQDNADATVAAALAAGIHEFDTAPWYGAGSSEERLGRAVLKLEGASGVRVTTKAGRLFRQPDGKTPCAASFEEAGSTPLHERVVVNDYTASGARTSLSESLARTRLSEVYALRIHDPNDNSTNDGSVDEVAIALSADGMCGELRRMRKAGRISHVGLGMNCNREPHQGKPEEILRLLRENPTGTFDSALLAGGWNLLSQDGAECFAECERLGVAVHVAGVFGSGLLVGGSTYAYVKAPDDKVEKARRWRELAERHGLSLPAVAIAFAALPRCVTRVVLGMATPEQLRENLAAVEESNRVPVSLWAEARDAGLLDSSVPLPQE